MSDVRRVDADWDEYIAAVVSLTEQVRGDERAEDPVHRADGYRMIQSIVTNAHLNIAYPNPNSPEVIENYSLALNYAIPGADFKYSNVWIEPGRAYRFWGHRGTAHMVDFQFCRGWYPEDGEGSTVTIGHSSFDEMNIEVDADGAFEFVLSPQSHPGNWVPSDPETSFIIIRQIFYDWANEQPSELHCELLSDSRLPVDNGAEALAARLRQCTRSVEWMGSANMDIMHTTIRDVGDNTFVERLWGHIGGQRNQNYFIGVFDIEPGAALVFEWSPPETAAYWGLQLFDLWWGTLDYRNYTSSTNGFQTARSSDGMVRVLITPEDPGVTQWLDTVGRTQGQILLRCKHERDLSRTSTPILTAVDLHDLDLGDWQVSSAADRQREIAVRRQHTSVRFGR